MALWKVDRLLKGLGLMVGLLMVAVSSVAETPKPGWDVDSKRTLVTEQFVSQAKIDETCDVKRISCGLGARSSLITTDCALDDGTFVDFWIFDGTAGGMVTVQMKSVAFDTFLFLLDPTAQVVAVDDDGGDGTNSQITFAFDATGEWTIAANNLFALSEDPGIYALELSCHHARVEHQ